ncbi:MAG: hypothetical protein ACUVQ0_00195 [Thermoproteota archaeon]
MPVKKYRTRYVVLKVGGVSKEAYGDILKFIKDVCKERYPGFNFKVVHENGDIVILRCPHLAVAQLRLLLSGVAYMDPALKLSIKGVSGSLKKARIKFCPGKGVSKH